MVLRRSRKRQRFKRKAMLSSLRSESLPIQQNQSIIITSNMRRLVIYARHLPQDPKHKPSWWISHLKQIGIIPMQLSYTQVSRDALLNFISEHPLPKGSPLIGKPIVGYIPTSCTMKIGLTIPSLLAETNFVTNVNQNLESQCYYETSKLVKLNITITPHTHEYISGGMIAAAITPITTRQFNDDYLVKKRESHSFNDLLRTPGLVFKQANTPTHLTYIPTPSDPLYKWVQFGTHQLRPEQNVANVVLSVGYTDLSFDTLDSVKSFNPSHCMFDVTIESTVQLKEYSDVRCYADPVQLLDVDAVNDSTSGRNIFYKRFYNHQGLQLRSLKK